jgi:phosphonate transport system substrate-binding protein
MWCLCGISQHLEEGLKTSRYAFAMARPSDYPARAMRDSGYTLTWPTPNPMGSALSLSKKIRQSQDVG